MRAMIRMAHAMLGACLAIGLSACGGGGGSRVMARPDGTSCNADLCVDYAYRAMAQVPRVLTVSIAPTGVALPLAHLSTHYRVVAGALPAGMSLDASTGEIAGAATTNGQFDADIELTIDGYSNSLTAHATIVVAEGRLYHYAPQTTVPGPTNSSINLVLGSIQGTPPVSELVAPTIDDSRGQSYSTNIGATNPTHMVFSILGDTQMPPGLALDPATGFVTGTPTTPGAWVVHVGLVMSAGGASTTMDDYFVFTVAAMIREPRGEPAAGPVQYGVHFDADAPIMLIEPAYGGSTGAAQSTMGYDSSSHIITVNPWAAPADAAPIMTVGGGEVAIYLPHDIGYVGYINDVI